MNVPPTVLFDLDGVLADFDTGLRERVAATYGPRWVINDADRRSWSYADDYLAVHGDDAPDGITQVHRQPGFYRSLPPHVAAVDAFRTLALRGWHTAICSAPSLSNPTCASDKLAWVAHHLGSDAARHTVLTKDKTLVAGTYLLDDKLEITGTHPPQWTHLLVSTATNRRGHYPHRFHRWKDLLKRIGDP